MSRQFVTFRIAEQRHAVPLAAVERAVRSAMITPVPGTPPELMGVIDVQGRVLPVLSVARRFGLSQGPIVPEGHFLIARMGSRTAVLPVDEVLDVEWLDSVTGGESLIPGLDHLEGVARLADGLLLIHDLERFFSPEQWRAVEDSIASANA